MGFGKYSFFDYWFFLNVDGAYLEEVFLHDAVELGGFIRDAVVSTYAVESGMYGLGPVLPEKPQSYSMPCQEWDHMVLKHVELGGYCGIGEGVPVEPQKVVDVPFCGNMLAYLGVTMPIMN